MVGAFALLSFSSVIPAFIVAQLAQGAARAIFWTAGQTHVIRDGGMFHDANVKLPRFVGTKTPEEVAAGVLRAIERDRAEVDVAPLGLRAGAAFAGLAPELSARVQRRLGGAKVAEDMARGQAGKRV